ncbi:Lys-63-specific deubiquitinase BRCC36 [Ananas comosus]|uniref:Lys-63-specific deubiquitinase BRCC36 n=1 Tax=Ananas comosus TaxID=4615 RepID=A0A199UQS5_ANACO|nr:Lys-63-specific deubiquitinase BRCC36 [Ananas comosus]
MSLTAVKMSEDVWLACLAHALTTETEEIMGLLLGDIQYSSGGNAVALIWGASPQMRSDRRKDRVETNPEMTLTTGRTTRVIGWYHSHPHITVLPSHVDVRTQAMYQLLDPGFIGLIFSCFSEDAHKVGRIQVIAFQSLDGKQRHLPPVNNSSIIEVESSLSSLENALSTSGSAMNENIEQDTGDSRAAKAKKMVGRSSDLEEFFSHADVNHLGKRQSRENSVGVYNPESAHNAAAEIDSADMNPSMQEALHRSNMDISGAEYIRKEVPLQVLPTRYLLKLESPLTSFTDMQHVLLEEERSAYNQAMSQNMRDGKVHPLTFIHHTSTYQASLCNLSPAVTALQDRLKENEIRLLMLNEEAKLLEAEALGRSGEMKMGSPRPMPSSQGLRGSTAPVQKDVRASAEQGSSRSPSGIGSRRKAF